MQIKNQLSAAVTAGAFLAVIVAPERRPRGMSEIAFAQDRRAKLAFR
jgi:hypothetical protein